MNKILILAFKNLLEKKFTFIILSIQLLIAIVVINISIALITDVFSFRNFVMKAGLEEYLYFSANAKYNHLDNREYNSLDNREIETKLSQISGLEGFGTIFNSFAAIENGDKIIETVLFDQKTLDRVMLPLQSGSWFDEVIDTKAIIPIIVSSDLKDEYILNHVYKLKYFLNMEKDDSSIDLSVKVIGVLEEPDYYLPLAGNYIEAAIKDNFGGMILPYSGNIKKNFRMEYNGQTILFPKRDNDISLISKQLKDYGQVISFGEAVKQHENSKKSLIFLVLSLGILVLIISIAGLGGNSALSMIADEKKYAVYYLCGAKWRNCILIGFTKDIMMLLTPCITSIIIMEVIRRLVVSIRFTSVTTNFLLSTGLCATIYIIASSSSVVSLYRKSPVSIIRKWV